MMVGVMDEVADRHKRRSMVMDSIMAMTMAVVTVMTMTTILHGDAERQGVEVYQQREVEVVHEGMGHCVGQLCTSATG
jgi:hypothetical protein